MQKGVDYEVFDVRENPRSLKEMVDISGKRQVPVIVVGDDHRVGFDPREIDLMLAAVDL
ncbi:MAG TPA: glutaredoxin family protein [Proteobacteria bacterium]|nr:glutaredoxin family protein [Pseudomonadota bacterium]